MKLSIACLVASAVAEKIVAEKPWFTKELQVIAAYNDGITGEDLPLQDPKSRSNKLWHQCGAKPPLPVDGQSVECSGAYCVAVCPRGYRSRGRWRIKCQNDNTWAHTNFSPCITCDPLDTSNLDSRINVQSLVNWKNLPVHRFFCGDSTDSIDFLGDNYKKGGNWRVAKCICRKGQNGDPWWRNSCNWEAKKKGVTTAFDQSSIDTIKCNSNQPTNQG